MLLQDVLDAPELGIRLLHGDSDALTRPVLRACTTDMPDPTRYVSAGSLVFTGLVWRRTAADADLFVTLLARAGVSALAAGEALHGQVPSDVVEACVRHGIPLLSVPEEVPFSRVIEYMTGRMAGARMDRLQTGLARQRRLLTAVADGCSLDELTDRTAREFGVSAWLLTATGMPVAGADPLPDEDVDALTRTALTADRLPAEVAGGYTVLPVGSGLADRIGSWYLVVRHAGTPDAECLDAFGELAAVAALDRVRREERRRLGWEAADRTPPGGDIDCGRSPVAVVVDRAPAGTPEQRAAMRAAVQDALSGAVTTVDVAGRVVALVDGDESEVVAALRRRLVRLAPALARTRLLVGVSACGTGESVDGAVRSAAAAVAAARDDAGAVCVRAAELDSALGLFTAVPDQLRRAFAGRILGPVLEHDRRTDAGLLATLEAFLDCDGSWRRTADRLHVHLNTVRYRIGRVEALTGRDLGRIGDRLDVYLAVRALA
ncbi:PucR family transcriptional regulator [Rhodococcus aetherivorans]|uniref:PucR family transcriptional regulator n=1 Tax=Rhodococcus aetherivorans TaxID=191292 RepID=UPI0036AD9045